MMRVFGTTNLNRYLPRRSYVRKAQQLRFHQFLQAGMMPDVVQSYPGSTRLFSESSNNDLPRSFNPKQPIKPAKPRHKSKLLNEDITSLARDGHWNEMLNLYMNQKHNFDGVNYSTFISQYVRGRGARESDPRFLELNQDFLQKVGEFGLKWLGAPREVASLIQSLSKARLHPSVSGVSRLIKMLGEGDMVEWMFKNGNPQDFANCARACGKLRMHCSRLFSMIENEAQWFIDNGSAQAIANSIWACGKLGIKSPRLFRLLEENPHLIFDDGTPQHVANCLWAYAKLGVEPPKLFECLDQKAEWMFEVGNTQSVASCAWACGRLYVICPKLFELLEKNVQWMFQNGNAVDISHCAWACGRLCIESPNLFQSLEQHVGWISTNGNAQDIAFCIQACGKLGIRSPNLFLLQEQKAEWIVANVSAPDFISCIWSCARLDVHSPKLFALIEPNAEWIFANGSPENVSQCIWAMGCLGILSPRLFQLLEESSERILQEASTAQIANCSLGLALVGFDAGAYLAALEGCSRKIFARASVEELCTLCYATAVLDVNTRRHSVFLGELWQEMLIHKPTALSVQSVEKILFVQAYAKAFTIDLELPSRDLQKCIDSCKIETATSKFDDNVSQALLGLGFAHKSKASVFPSFPDVMKIDIANRDQMIAIECDEPSCYVSLLGEVNATVESGPTIAKRLVLQKLGWTVINLNMAEAFAGNSVSKEWLRGKLSDYGVQLE